MQVLYKCYQIISIKNNNIENIFVNHDIWNKFIPLPQLSDYFSSIVGRSGHNVNINRK